MNTFTEIDTFNNPSQGGFNDENQDVSPRAKPARVIITQDQFDSYIGNLVDITSKMNKTINRQGKLKNYMKIILDDFCEKSNGGMLPTEINQHTWRDQIPSKILSRIIKNLIHHNLIVKHANHCSGVRATFYIGGNTMFSLLDSFVFKKMIQSKKCLAKAEKYWNFGYSKNETKLCPCCNTERSCIEFKLMTNSGLLSPVCDECSTFYNKNRNVAKPPTWKAAWRAFYALEENSSLTEAERKMILDGQIETLINEMV